MRESGLSNDKSKTNEVVMKAVKAFLKELRADKINDVSSILTHVVGNMMNEVIFGVTYEKGDPFWLKQQRLREEGYVKSGIL